jgi:hypothetical protein
MKSTANFEFSRRTLMRAAGSTLMVPTFLKNAFAQTATPARPNLVMMMQTNGTHQASFWPTGTTFDSPILHNLLADPVVGPKTTLINGVNLNKQGNPVGNGHDWGWHGLYSGVDNISMGAPFGGGPSLDQILIKKLTFTQPFANIHFGVVVADYRLINAGRASFSCSAPGAQIPCETDIYSLYTKVFASIDSAPPPVTSGTSTAPDPTLTAAKLRLAQRMSVLDAVAQDLTTLEGRLGTAERNKVDAHLTAVRDLETRLSTSLTASTQPRGAGCTAIKPSVTGIPTTGTNNEVSAPALNSLAMEFIANAIACNMVGVITFQFGRGGDHYHYDWLNLPGMQPDFHNDIAHQDKGNDSTSGTPGGVMIGVAQYHAGLVLSLGQKLATFPQANGKTALDNSLVCWGNELATGPHGINGYPIVFVGGAAGKLLKTGYMVNTGTQIHQRLGCTLSNIMGDPVAGFGWVPDCGPFVGLGLAT